MMALEIPATQPDEAPGFAPPGATGGVRFTTIPPFTPDGPLWMCASVAPLRLSTVMPQQTGVVVGKMIVGEPMASRPPFRQTGPGTPHSFPPFSTVKSGAPKADWA